MNYYCLILSKKELERIELALRLDSPKISEPDEVYLDLYRKIGKVISSKEFQDQIDIEEVDLVPTSKTKKIWEYLSKHVNSKK